MNVHDYPPVQRYGGLVQLHGRALAEAHWLIKAGRDAVFARSAISPTPLTQVIIKKMAAALKDTAAAGNAEVPEEDVTAEWEAETAIPTSTAAELLGIGDRQVRNIRSRIGGRKVGGVLLFDLAAVEAEAQRRNDEERKAAS